MKTNYVELLDGMELLESREISVPSPWKLRVALTVNGYVVTRYHYARPVHKVRDLHFMAAVTEVREQVAEMEEIGGRPSLWAMLDTYSDAELAEAYDWVMERIEKVRALGYGGEFEYLAEQIQEKTFYNGLCDDYTPDGGGDYAIHDFDAERDRGRYDREPEQEETVAPKYSVKDLVQAAVGEYKLGGSMV